MPFRLFTRPSPPAGPDGAAGDAAAWPPRPWGAGPAPATRHARPIAFGQPPRPAADDPPTDPHGFPPIRPGSGGPAHGSDQRPLEPPDAREAAALAAAFAADYLSWDEDEPERRARALAEHVAVPDGSAPPGWDGRGRQRAEFAVPGAVEPDGDGRVLVDVRVRVTPYGADDAAEGAGRGTGVAADVEPAVPGTPAAAPAPSAPGWRAGASHWIRLAVPVVRDAGRLVVEVDDDTVSAPRDDPADRRHERVRELRDVSVRPAGSAADAPPTRLDRALEGAW